MTIATSTIGNFFFLATRPERAGFPFRRSHEERTIPRVGGSSSCRLRERIRPVAVLLNASTDAVVRRPGNRWRSRHRFSYRVPPSVERRALLALPVIRDYLINCSRKGVSACMRSRLERSSSRRLLRDVRVASPTYILFVAFCIKEKIWFGISRLCSLLIVSVKRIVLQFFFNK